MKILLAITTDNHKQVGDRALRWCSRLGVDTRLFVPKNKRKRFLEVLADAAYHYYLDLRPENLVSRTDARSYADQHGYDLLVTVPPDLWSWRKGMQFKTNEIVVAYTALAKGRAEFTDRPRKRIKRWSNGVTMERRGSRGGVQYV